MELWIRTQDREVLLPAKLEMQATGSRRIGYLMYGLKDYSASAVMLGTYKTKERALEVLDEIQNILGGKTILKSFDNITPDFRDKVIIKPCEVHIEQLNTYVYEMPKE